MSASQIFNQLNQLYSELQIFFPDWCRENPFVSIVRKCPDAELGNLAVSWKQWIDVCEAQIGSAAPVVTSQHPFMDYFAQDLSSNLAVQQLDVRPNYEPMDYDQAIAVPAPQASFPLTAPLVETNTGDGTIALPAWLSLIRPKPEDQVINVRRECMVVLDIKLMELPAPPGPPPVTRKSLVVPWTASVKTNDDRGGGGVMHLSVRVFGADTKIEYKSVCHQCSKREGKRKGKPSLVDFCAASNVIKASDDGTMHVKFKFSCYPNHQDPNESGYLVEVALLENQHQGQLAPSQRVVATCRLPWHFIVRRLTGRRVVPAASTSGAVPFHNDPGSPSGHYPMDVDIPQAIAVPTPQMSLPLTVPLVEPYPDDGTTTLPAWLSLVRPQPVDQVITVRLECQVVLGIKFNAISALAGPCSVTRLVVPSTANVKINEYQGEGNVMHLSVRVFGADTNSECKSVCNRCSTREGKRKEEPSLVDFYAASDVIKASDDGSMHVKFKFSCYPNHQNPSESAYLLEVALLENQYQGQLASLRRVVATCRLPWHFKVGKRQSGQGSASASGAVPFQKDPSSPSEQVPMAVDTQTPRPSARNELGLATLVSLLLSSPGPISLSEGEHQGTPCVPPSNSQAPVARDQAATLVAGPMQRKRGQGEADLDDEDSHNHSWRRPIREQLDNALVGTAGPSAPSANHSPSRPFATPSGTIPHGVSSSNSPSNSPATSATPSAPQPDPSLHPVQRHQSPAQPVEQTSTLLRAVNPRCGPVSGGIEILLEVEDAPTTFPLYAKFGDKIAATSVWNECTLACVLPSASHAGRVQVTLSRSAHIGAPQYGTGVSEFEYLSDHALLIPILLRMEARGPPEYAPTLRAVVTLLQGDQAPPGAAKPRGEQIGSSVLEEPLSLRE